MYEALLQKVGKENTNPENSNNTLHLEFYSSAGKQKINT